jgi:hypothetical protein
MDFMLPSRLRIEAWYREQRVLGSLRAALGNTTVRDLVVLAAFFGGVHGLLLLDYAPRWDGWVIYYRIQDRDWPSLLAGFRALGIPAFAYLHYLVGQLPYFLFWFKFTTFLSLLTTTLITYHLLGDFPAAIGRADRLLLCMLLATFPANLVNIELIMMPFAVCYACFFVAAAVYRRSIRSEGTPSLLLRLLALGLFYFSFMMQSLLVFYAVFLLYAFASSPGRADRAGVRLIMFVKRHADFIALPVLYWVVRAVWFRPFGEYAGYNAFQHRLASVVADLASSLYGGLVVPLARGVHETRQLPAVALVVLAAVLLLRPLWASAQWERQGRLLALGFGLACVGLLPYVVVGKSPAPPDPWVTRFAYLVPLGAAFLVYASLKWYLSFIGAPRYVIMTAASFVVAAFATADVANYLTFGIDGLKQEAIVLGFRDQREIAAAATIVVEDSAEWLSAYDRQFRVYEYTGMLKQAFGDERRLGIRDGQYHDRAYMDVVSRVYGKPKWLLSGYDGRGTLVRVRLRSEAATWNLRQLYLKAVYLRLRGRSEERNALLRQLLSIQLLPPDATSRHSSSAASTRPSTSAGWQGSP